MSEHTQNNQTLVIGLVVVAVLLAALVGVLVWKQSSAVPPVSAPATSAPAGDTTGATGSSTGMPPAATDAAATEVDPANATKVPEGTEPEAFVKAYYDACDADDWDSAFKMLPVAKQQGNSAEALKSQVSGYGIESWEITDVKVEGDTATVMVDQVTGSYGTFTNQWTFSKVDGVWVVTDKAVVGMK